MMVPKPTRIALPINFYGVCTYSSLRRQRLSQSFSVESNRLEKNNQDILVVS